MKAYAITHEVRLAESRVGDAPTFGTVLLRNAPIFMERSRAEFYLKQQIETKKVSEKSQVIEIELDMLKLRAPTPTGEIVRKPRTTLAQRLAAARNHNGMGIPLLTVPKVVA